MAPRPETATCATCVYWHNPDDGESQCRRDPPQIFDDGTSNWPPTVAEDWCGYYSDDWETNDKGVKNA